MQEKNVFPAFTGNVAFHTSLFSITLAKYDLRKSAYSLMEGFYLHMKDKIKLFKYEINVCEIADSKQQ